FVAQGRDSRAGGVGILAPVDRVDGGLLDGLRHVEIRLANTQVDGILQSSTQLEYLANPRDLDGSHPLGDPISLHTLRLHLNRHSCRTWLRPSSREAPRWRIVTISKLGGPARSTLERTLRGANSFALRGMESAAPVQTCPILG